MPPAPLPLPALFPPADTGIHSWPAPNYINPETRDWTASICLIVLFVVTLFIFVARIWSRFVIVRNPGLDDWLIIVAMPMLLGLTIATVLGLRVYGFQLHIYDQTPKTYITVRQITLAIETIYLGCTTLTRISILLFYRRITSSLVSRPLKIVVWAAIIFVAAYGIAFIFVLIFTCWPVEAYWYRFTTSWLKAHPYYKCHDELVTLVVIISISTAQDFIVCIAPMFVVRKLRIPRRQKLGLIGIFALGLATCAIGALRVHYAHRVFYFVKSGSKTYDISWEALGSWVSTAVESNLAVICASAPALRPYCKCFNTDPSIRTFGWYHGHKEPKVTTTSTSSSRFSRASTAVVRMGCCFGCISFEAKIPRGSRSAKSSKNDSAFASMGSRPSRSSKSGSKKGSTRGPTTSLPRNLDIDEIMLPEWPEDAARHDGKGD